MRRSVPSWAKGASGLATGASRLQRADGGGGVGLRDTEPLGQGRQGTGGGIAEGRRAASSAGKEDVDPLIGFALAHAEQASLDHLEAVGFRVGEQEERPVFGCRQRQFWYTLNRRAVRGLPSKAHAAMYALGTPPRRAESAAETRRGQAGEIQELRGTGLQIGKPYSGHWWCLLSGEAQYIINRDNLI